MKKSFNLIDEKWVPVLDADGRRHDVGLRDALVDAHKWQEVHSDNPIETAALNRLLLAIVIDGFLQRPDEDLWWESWDARRFEPTAVDAYFNDPRRSERFDLLHPDRPFYQHPDPLSGANPGTLSRLFHAESSGNNATLFGHDLDARPRLYSLPEIARGIICTQAAAMGGGVSKPFNYSHAPLVAGALFWIRGRSLFEALHLNASPEPDARMLLESDDDLGLPPAWERPLPDEYSRRPVSGYVDYLTWQARRLTLATASDGIGEAVVPHGVYITQGDKDEPPVINDPLRATVHPPKKDPYSYGLRAGRAIWRDADILFALRDMSRGFAPRTFSWLRYVSGITDISVFTVDVFGIINDQAKIEAWRHEQMPIYPVLLSKEVNDTAAVRFVMHALDAAQEQREILIRALRTTAGRILAPPSANGEDRRVDKDEVTAFVKSLGAEDAYWSALEPLFYEFLRDLAEHSGKAFSDEERQNLVWQWSENVYTTARSAYSTATSHLDQNARQLRALVEGTRHLMRTQSYRDYRKSME